MAISGLQVINIGLQNESTGSDSLYIAFNKTKDNFANLFADASPYDTFTGNTGITVNANSTAGTVDIINTGVTNIIAGTNITIDQSNGNVTISTTGSNITPGGSNTQVQFNDAGSLGGNTNFTFNKTTGVFSALYLSGNGNGLSNIQGANVSGAVGLATYATTANAVAGANVSGAVAYASTANSVAGANVSGTVSSATTAGTVTTAAQPNITSVGTLSSLTVSGNVSANYIIGNGSQLTNLPAPTITEASTGDKFLMVTDGSLNYNGHVTVDSVTGDIATLGNITLVNIVTANVLVGNLSTAAQPNITSVGTLANVRVSGAVIFNGSQNLATGTAVSLTVTASYFTTTGASTATLAAGTAGQIKTFMMLSSGGDMVITVTNPAWGGSGTMTFSNTGDACTLQYIASKWFCVGNNGAVFA